MVVKLFILDLNVECEDIFPNCGRNANENTCRTNGLFIQQRKDFLRNVCQKSCGVCGTSKIGN